MPSSFARAVYSTYGVVFVGVFITLGVDFSRAAYTRLPAQKYFSEHNSLISGLLDQLIDLGRYGQQVVVGNVQNSQRRQLKNAGGEHVQIVGPHTDDLQFGQGADSLVRKYQFLGVIVPLLPALAQSIEIQASHCGLVTRTIDLLRFCGFWYVVSGLKQNVLFYYVPVQGYPKSCCHS